MSTADNVSEIYSLYSRSMTPSRVAGSASSKLEDFPTPLGGPMAQQITKPVLGPRSMPDKNGDLVRVHPSSMRYEDSVQDPIPIRPEFRSPHDSGPEPYEEYFSIPTIKESSGLNDMRRRRSTKELIKRFESMGTENSQRTSPSHVARGTPIRTHRIDYDLFTPPIRAEKKTSPLRQSFRNLLSVFKKGKRLGKEKVDSYVVLKESGPPFPDGKISTAPARADHNPDAFTNDAGPGSRICTSPTYSLHTGLLLHLSAHTPTSSPILPVWIPCDAVLHRSHILLTSATTQGIPRTDVVSLRACTDVKSLTSGEIGMEQKALLPAMETSADPKVFELFFDGKEKRRFAAPTVKDRAAWVSAIWDAILQSQDRQLPGLTKTEIKNSLRIDTEALPVFPGAGSPITSKPVSTTEVDSPGSQGGELGPLSRDVSSTRLAISSSPTRSRLLPEEHGVASTQKNLVETWKMDLEHTPSTGFKSRSSSSTRSSHSQSNSPSIVNLGRRSVVRKRLAEIQHHPISSTSRSHDSRQSPTRTVSRLTTRARQSEAGNSDAVSDLADSGSLIDVLGRPATTEPLKSSASSHVSSTLSDRDGCLTSPMTATPDRSESPLPVRPKSAFRLRDEMRARDPTLMPHRRASERSRSLSIGTPHVDSHVDGTVGALLDVMDVHAERQLIKTAQLGKQLESVQNDMRDVAANVRVANSGREQDSQHLEEMHTALNDLRIALAHRDAQQRDNGTTAITVDERLKSNQAEIFQALAEIQAMLKGNALDSTVHGEAEPGLVTGEQTSASLPNDHSSATEHPDLTDIRQKLDMLVGLSVPKPHSASSIPPPSPYFGASPDSTPRTRSGHGKQVAKPEPTNQATRPHASIMHNAKGSTDDTQSQNSDEALGQDEDARAQLLEQQAESVRYLNELNTWLETFVNGGTAQIMAIAEDVQKLCKALGNADELQGGPEGGTAGASQAATFTVLQGIRKLADDSKRRDRDSAHLLSTMNGLVAALNEDMRKNAEMRNAYTTESVLGVIERQRQDQERLLRSLADELSDDIRGERLRFVEAMKEATAINVQIHVEEFKKELTREVLISTQEVGRLQRERQLLEQQIADLFAFYSKQKQAVLGTTQPQSQPPHPLKPSQEQNRPPSRGGRALPPPPGQRQRP